MPVAVATPCPDYGSCWHPVALPDGAPLGSPEAAVVWGALFVLCLILLIRRLG